MSSKQDKLEWELPHLREAHQIPVLAEWLMSQDQQKDADLWSVKFYPYTEPGADPVFAVIGSEHILVCRIPRGGRGNAAFEVISSLLVDESPESENYACAWTKDLETGDPLLCVAGRPATIKIINALTGEIQRTFIGHGSDIDDLQVSPVNPQILASAGVDCTVRIWSLDPAHAKQPCIAILAGDGHRETILSIAFHASGRYLLSGGIDNIINLWVLPEFPDANTGTNSPTLIHYPHFSTSGIHTSHVDCVAFYNDLILSKCDKEQCIVLWSINGFSSLNPPPSPDTAPTTHDSDTRSAFTSSPEPYTRLLQFEAKGANIMFTRFSLYPGSATTNPVLAFCTVGSKVYFWDLARLEIHHDYLKEHQSYLTQINPNGSANEGPTSSSRAGGQGEPPRRPNFLVPFRTRNRASGPSLPFSNPVSRLREPSPTASESSSHHSHPSTTTNTASNVNLPISSTYTNFTQPGEKPLSEKEFEKSKEIWEKRYRINDAWYYLTPHKEEIVRGLQFTGRQVAWSPGGEWCVVVGSAGTMAVFERWVR